MKSAASFELVRFTAHASDRQRTGPVTLSLTTGEGAVLSGPVGSGKSLVCEYLAGLRRTGIDYGGSSTFLDTSGEPTGGRTALCPQDWRLVALRTDRVQTLVAAAGATVTGYLDLLELDLARLRDLDLTLLAASERARLLLACALAEDPDLLVLDGLADVLDPRQRRLVATAMEAALSAGTMLVVSARDEAPWVTSDLHLVQTGEPVGKEAVAVPLMQKRKEGERAVAKPPALDVSDLDIEHGRHGLFARAKRALVVDGATLFVRGGEILVLLGPSGSGKSTLLAAMAGHLPSHAGRIRLGGVDVTNWRGRKARDLRSRVQLVSMDIVRRLDPTRTLGEHLQRCLPKADATSGAQASLESWLDRLGLPPHLAHVRADHLSEAEGFRLALGLALCADPRVVLLDAPRSGALDADGGTLTGLLLAEKARGRSFVLATSDPGISRSIADRIAILDAGRMLEFGPTSLVLGKPAHPRTVGLLGSAAGPHHDPRSPRSGCHMAGACPREVERCRAERPPLDFVPGATRNHRVACFNPSLEQIAQP